MFTSKDPKKEYLSIYLNKTTKLFNFSTFITINVVILIIELIYSLIMLKNQRLFNFLFQVNYWKIETIILFLKIVHYLSSEPLFDDKEELSP